MDKNSDEKYMARAIELAKRGTGGVNPNPLVGAVIVKDGKLDSMMPSDIKSFHKLK